MIHLKKIIAVMLSIMITVTAVPLAVKAAGTSASTIALMKKEGTVKVLNTKGKSLTARAKMKLYSGYSVKTGAKSYAYVSLDSTKSVKLDAQSNAVIKKSGKKLELNVKSGKLFFNVKKPLKSSEVMNIKTSTMTMGIRGTSGIVCQLKEKEGTKTTVQLYDGKATIKAVNPVTKKSKTVTIQAGQMCTAYINKKKEIVISKSKLSENMDQIPGFAAIEIKKDSKLTERVKKESGLNVNTIKNNAADKLKEDEKTAGERETSGETGKPSAGGETQGETGKPSAGGEAPGETEKPSEGNETSGEIPLTEESIQNLFTGGDGSAENPFQIGSANQLKLMNEAITVLGPKQNFKLLNDIDMVSYGNWTPVGGTYQKPAVFLGNFDGNGYVIKNLKTVISDKNDKTPCGLFSYIGNGSFITNLGLMNCTIQGAGNAGGIAGENRGGKIAGCYTDGAVKSTESSAGGIVGFNNMEQIAGTISDCYSLADVTGKAAGGIAGEHKSATAFSIRNCFSTGSITGTQSAGGIIGSITGTGGAGNCISINRYIKCSNGKDNGRIAGIPGNGKLNDNHAFYGTLIGSSEKTMKVVIGGKENDKNGVSCTLLQLIDPVSYKGKNGEGGFFAPSFGENTITLWNFDQMSGRYKLPVLKKPGSENQSFTMPDFLS